MTRECPGCGRLILVVTTRCPYCDAIPDTATKAIAAVPQSAANWVEDKRPDGTTYRTYVGRVAVPDRQPSYPQLAYLLPDMRRGELSHGIGVDLLAEVSPWVYSRARAG